jgi:hypothetical protein
MRQERNEARRAADFREPFGLADLRHRHDAIATTPSSQKPAASPTTSAPMATARSCSTSSATPRLGRTDRWKKLSREFAGPAAQ